MKVLHRPLFLLLSFCLTLLAACSGSEEAKKDETTNTQQGEFKKTDQDEKITPKTDVPPDREVKQVEKQMPPAEKEPPRKELPPQQQKIETPPPVTSTPKTGQVMWSVQIGAFKNETGALEVANAARTKFSQPIYKDYDPVSGFYKVTIGSFATYDQASKFKLEVQAQGYPDAFPVEVRR